jgi:hypothetical protein
MGNQLEGEEVAGANRRSRKELGWDRSEGLGERPEQLHANPLRSSPPGSETIVQIAVMKLDRGILEGSKQIEEES